MADIADKAGDSMDVLEAARVSAVHAQVMSIPLGHQGECDKCGNHSTRLLGSPYFNKHKRFDIADEIDIGICPPCRDRLKLP